MYTDSYPEPTDPTGNLVWREDEDGANVLTDSLTGQTVKTVLPLFLPDGTLMKTMTLFRVEAAREMHITPDTSIEKGSFLIAKKLPNGDICLFTNSAVPFLITVGAEYKKDFKFITDLNKFKDCDLKLKLTRVLEIENYEYAVKIRDEINRRNLTSV